MKILITDDSATNLEYVKNATEKFPRYDFQFHSSPSEAYEQLPAYDALITDLFFPREEDENLLRVYRDYIMRTVNSTVFENVINEYYNGDRQRADIKLKDTLGVMQEGTIRAIVERQIEKYENPEDFFTGRRQEPQAHEREEAENLRRLLNELPPPQFPYGGSLMLEAKRLGMPCVLVTDLHRHAGNFHDQASAVDGMITLLPLIESGIVTVYEVVCDGKGSNTYIGHDDMHERSKENAETWEYAISKVLKQK